MWPFHQPNNQAGVLWDDYLHCTSVAKSWIEIPQSEDRPAWCAPYTASPKLFKAKKSEIDKIGKIEIIEPSKTECASPIVLGSKNHGATFVWQL